MQDRIYRPAWLLVTPWFSVPFQARSNVTTPIKGRTIRETQMTENQLFLAIAALRLEAARTKSQELREACDAAADCLWLKREVLWRH